MPSASRLDVRPCEGGSLLRLRVKPKARADSLIGLYAGRLKVSVKDPPDRGKANEAVCRLLARFLGLPVAAVTVCAGETSQDKTARIEGLSPAECERRLTASLADSAEGP
jgi:uncharacterized protein